MNKHSKTKGFTLIELMIVVAIIAIISAIAYPSYQNSVIKTRRSDGKVALNDASVQLERCFTMYGSYNNGNCGIAATLLGAGQVSNKGFYNVSVNGAGGALAASSFTLTAVPVAPQTADTNCGTLTLTNSGIKGWTGAEAHDAIGIKDCT